MNVSVIDSKQSLTTNNQMESLVEIENKQMVPAGYAKVDLSTKGKVGAPALFHIRNFQASEVMSLSLTEDRALPARILNLLSNMIFEKVDVRKFHEMEIIETLLQLYAAFYSPIMRDIPFPFNEDDIDSLKKDPDGESLIQDLKEGRWKPTVDIDIIKDVETYDLNSRFKSTATILDKTNGFSLGFRLPYFGDVLTVQEWLHATFGEREKQLASLASKSDARESMLQSLLKGDPINTDAIPYLSPEEENLLNDFRIEKATAVIDMIRAEHLMIFDGKDVSNLPLSEKIKLIKDPRVNNKIASKLEEHFQKLQFGIKPTVRMLNPITGEMCDRRFSFRLDTILQATQVSGDDNYEFISTD